jgi:RNA polymerase sigma-70 factor (ECF subfamily)
VRGVAVADAGQRFERVYADHYDAVLRYCLRRSSREDALDAAAETFTVAWRRQGDMPKGGELPWLYGVARRVLANQRRAASRRASAVGQLRSVPVRPMREPEPQVIQAHDTCAVLAAVARLRESDQEVIRLAGWEELDRHELAMVLGCTPNAVSKRLNRALDRLGHELGVEERFGGRFFRRGKVAQ